MTSFFKRIFRRHGKSHATGSPVLSPEPRRQARNVLAGAPNAPERTAKSRAKTSIDPQGPTEDASAEFDRLGNAQDLLASDIRDRLGELSHSKFFDVTFWKRFQVLAERQLQFLELNDRAHARFVNMYGLTSAQWAEISYRGDSQSAKEGYARALVRAQEKILQLQQKAAMEPDDGCSLVSCVFGLNEVGNSTGKRPKRRGAVRKALRLAYHHIPGPVYVDMAWDVVDGKRKNFDIMRTTHLFAVQHGVESLVAIFGEDSRDDLYSPANGLLVSVEIEKYMEAGLFCIVPDLPDDAKEEACLAWQASQPKEYRLRFLEKPDASAQPRALYNRNRASEKTWKQLDGKRLQFQNDRRPKACYIFFLYLVNLQKWILRDADSAAERLEAELGKAYWSMLGLWFKETHLNHFIKHLRHASRPDDGLERIRCLDI